MELVVKNNSKMAFVWGTIGEEARMQLEEEGKEVIIVQWLDGVGNVGGDGPIHRAIPGSGDES